DTVSVFKAVWKQPEVRNLFPAASKAEPKPSRTSETSFKRDYFQRAGGRQSQMRPGVSDPEEILSVKTGTSSSMYSPHEQQVAPYPESENQKRPSLGF
ncbi:Rab-3A-interacting protein, partial [Nibea albiflora]